MSLWVRVLCVLRHGGHVWGLPVWGLDGAILPCTACGHQHVVRYDRLEVR